jgi:hypothetical protein
MATVRRRERDFPVFPNEGRKIIRRTTRAHAEIYEALGIWRREYDGQTGELVGFRLVGAELHKGDADLRSLMTSASISEKEMQLNVGRSRTYGLREVDRMKLIKDGELPEDEVERTQAKVRVYPLIGAAQGDILRAWPL